MSNNKMRVIKINEGWNWLSAGVPIDDDYPEPFGELTDLEFSTVHGRTGIMKLLIEAGADVNAKSSTGLETAPLGSAICGGHTDAVQLLIDYGADLEIKDLLGKTCLFHAIEFGYWEILQVLLNSGAKVNVSDQWGITPLMYAVMYNNSEFVKILLASGADVNAADENGKTVFDFVSHKRYSIPILGNFFTSERDQEMLKLLEEAKLKADR